MPDLFEGWTFSRASAAFDTVNGTLVQVGPDVPREAGEGVLFEAAGKNHLLQSQTLGSSEWSRINCDVIAAA